MAIPTSEQAELKTLKKNFERLEEVTYGELTFTDAPALADSFEAGADGALWSSALARMTWVAEEADGGAVGYWTTGAGKAATTVVVHVDNEGTFRVTGQRFVDHLSWAARGDDADLRAFCVARKLRPPMTEAARKALAKGITLPDAAVEALQKAATSASAKGSKAAAGAARGSKAPAGKAKGSTAPAGKAKESKAPAGKAKESKASATAPKDRKAPAGKAPAPDAAKGPRPFSRAVVVDALPDGRVLVVTGEDYGGAYGETITSGACFSFAPDRSSFTRRAKAPLTDASPQQLFATPTGALLIACPVSPGRLRSHTWTEATDSWSKAAEVPIYGSHQELTIGRLPDGSVLVAGGGRAAAARWHAGAWKAIADLPEDRCGDRVMAIDAKTAWLLGGELSTWTSTVETDRTWHLELGTLRWRPGPTLPVAAPLHGVFRRRDGAYILIHYDQVWTYTNGSFGKPRAVRAFDVQLTHAQLDADTLVSLDNDGAVYVTSLATLAPRKVGSATLGQRGARLAPLPDGRVLFVGGTLFANNDAEPELITLSSGAASALPGYEAEVARQAKLFAKKR